VINHIQVSCGIEAIGSPTIIYKDNASYIVQMQSGYVKSNVTEHITPKLFYLHELQVNGEINIMEITKSLSYCTFSKYIVGISIRRLRDLKDLGGPLS
jgi:hypothetical protein